MPQLTPRRLRGVLPLLLDILLIVGLFALDIRDLYYKIGWIGPYDTFSFYAISFRTFDPKPAVLAANFTQDDRAVATSDRLLINTSRDSGWPSLLANCDVFYPAGTFLFIGGMGHDCTVYNNTDPDTQMTTTSTIPVLYMSASLRADSMAWAACKLLYRHRKPVICHDHIVTGFLDRYSLQDYPVTHKMMPLPFSDGENELLAVLRVIAKSEPLTRVTCVESFAYSGPGFYMTHIYGCGSPNSMDAAFVGVHATAFKDLHQDKAWLTVDTLNLMGFKYLMRQNVRSEFTAAVTATGDVTLTPNSRTNFSSGGSLYNLMVAIDVILLVVSFLSSLEIAWLMIVPLLSTHLTKEESDKAWAQFTEDYKTGFTSSLYRSRVFVILLTITQLISWVIMLPNSIIFTWSTSSKMAKLQAYLSSLRLWVLILMLFNEIWDWIVMISESFAYHVVCYTYIASYEILAIGALVSYKLRTEIFAIGNAKYALENQRTRDATSYAKRLTLQNAYNEELDYLFNTPSSIIWLMYKPLFKIIGWSIFFCVLLLVVRYGYFRVLKPMLLRKLGHKYAVAKILAGSTDAGASNDKPTSSTHGSHKYARLPLEELLNTPIRARCLVRASIDVETIRVNEKTHKTQQFILPAYFLEHGVLVDSYGQMHTRSGFFKFLQPKVKFDECMWEAAATLRKLNVDKPDETDQHKHQ